MVPSFLPLFLHTLSYQKLDGCKALRKRLIPQIDKNLVVRKADQEGVLQYSSQEGKVGECVSHKSAGVHPPRQLQVQPQPKSTYGICQVRKKVMKKKRLLRDNDDGGEMEVVSRE